MITVTLYIKPNCSACDQAIADLNELRDGFPHELIVVNIEEDKILNDAYQNMVPMVQVGPYKLKKEFTVMELKVALGAAIDRNLQMEKTQNKEYSDRIKRGRTLSGSDRISIWLAEHYMKLICLLLMVYWGLPFLAPVLMKAGAELPAKAIYTIYTPLCHQLPYRSWFLFGEQAYYPRELAKIPNVLTYEQVTGLSAEDVITGRAFVGNETLGYKVALCERDIAMYASLTLAGIIFEIGRRKMKSIPWYIWILLGLVPIGLDGFSQLPGLLSGMPGWMVIRESTPVIRTITGVLFGLTTGWYLFPMFEESMMETRRVMANKLAIVNRITPEEIKPA